MSAPTSWAYRLPSEAEVDGILKAEDAKTNKWQTQAGKAKSNLLKSLDWAYVGLDQDRKNVIAYHGKVKLGDALKNKDNISDDDVTEMLKSLRGFEVLRHSGKSRRGVDEKERNELKTLLDWIKQTAIEIESASETEEYGEHINRIFPADQGKDDTQSFATRKLEVVRRINRAEQSARELLQLTRPISECKVFVADHHPFVHSGGGAKPGSIELKPRFFNNKDIKYQGATLLHEATHTIAEPQMRTSDHCYIGQPAFKKALLATRYQNAAHFEALIRLINGLSLDEGEDGSTSISATNPGGRPSPEDIATEIVQSAWIGAWREFLDLAREHKQHQTKFGGSKPKGPLALGSFWKGSELIEFGHLMGLPMGKVKVDYGYFSDSNEFNFCDSDLAFLENRVGKLGVLMGAVGTAVKQLAQSDKSVGQFTDKEYDNADLQKDKVEKIIAKLIEIEGPLRTNKNNRKTVDMIMALAEKKIRVEGGSERIGPIVTGRLGQFIATYPIK